MAKYSIEDKTLTDIANAIREKTKTTAELAPRSMPAAILEITTGDGESFYITGDATALFSRTYNSDIVPIEWFKRYLGHFCSDKMKTKDLTKLTGMFSENTYLTEIPFSLNITSDLTQSRSVYSCFLGMTNLIKLPKINGKVNGIGSFCAGCQRLVDVSALADVDVDLDVNTTRNFAFRNCHSIRHIPSSFIKKAGRTNADGSSHFYYYSFNYCHVLEAIENMGVGRGTLTKDAFTQSFSHCYRLKKLTFETNGDGTPIVANWKNQTIDLSLAVGHLFSNTDDYVSRVTTQYNSGITNDKRVNSQEDYERLKNDPDWFTGLVAYSRYNHNSAVETINSLPDTSAYLAANGGTNTIKFTKNAGSATDGGAISTLTEEEIAVAAAKGWTVSLE